MNKISSTTHLLEKGRISAFQITLLFMTLIISTADVLLPAFVAQETKQDSWIAVIIGTLSALVLINFFLTLGLKRPNKTLVQYSCDILGKPLGKIISYIYFYFFIIITALTIRKLAEILEIFFKLDISIVSIVIILSAAYNLNGGLEVITRVNQFLFPFGVLALLLIGYFNIFEMNFHYFLPILSKGIIPSLKGAFLIQNCILRSIILLQLIPFVKNKNKLRKNISIATILLGTGLMIGVFMISIFGHILTGKLIFPALEYVRFVQLGYYIEHIDILITVIWISGIFINISIYYYGAVLSLAQLFNLKSYKSMINPIGIIIFSFSILIIDKTTELLDFFHYIIPFYIFTVSFIVPSILILISTIRNNLIKKGG